MTIINVLGQIERYELVELNNKKVYFPKENKAYIEELLESKDPDKLLYIADFYTEFHEDELAYYYFNSYTGYNSEFKARIANKLGVELATKELQPASMPPFVLSPSNALLFRSSFSTNFINKFKSVTFNCNNLSNL